MIWESKDLKKKESLGREVVLADAAAPMDLLFVVMTCIYADNASEKLQGN